MAKFILKPAKRRSNAPPKFQFRPCILCPKRAVKPIQLCTKFDNRVRTLTGPNASAIEKDLLDIITQGCADHRLSAVEKFAQTHTKKFGKL